MTTFDQMVDDTLAQLRGYVRDQEISTYLTAGIDSDDLTATVNDGTVVSRGRVEIGDELIYVEQVDRSTGLVTIPPYGRGTDYTTAASHSSGDKVTVAPLFPRSAVKRALNDIIRSVDLFAVASTTVTSVGGQWTYGLPAAVKDVLWVEWEAPYSPPEWLPLRRWTLNRMADPTDFTGGRSLQVGEGVTPGQSIRVTYSKDPTALSAGSDAFTTVTGLPESAYDCVLLGAVARMLVSVEAFLLNTRAIEPNQLDTKNQPQMPTQLSKYVYQLFKAREAEERASLLKSYPVRSHFAAR